MEKSTSAAPLVVFRIVWGAMLLASVVRFWTKGWIDELYIRPAFFFPYYGFGFVHPLGEATYAVFAVCGLCALLAMIGLWYRWAATGLFLSFTYIELMDKTTYLNHYYFVSLVCLLLIFLPANVLFSVDAWRKPSLRAGRIPYWTTGSVRLLVALLYVFAGIAKLNSDWLLEALPLRIWLPARNDMPVIGPLLEKRWVAYAFSWIGCLYDLTIPLWLLLPRTRVWGYAMVVVFHVLTALLFPIGMFPYVMIVTALIFFSGEWHERLLARLGRLVPAMPVRSATVYAYPPAAGKVLKAGLLVFFVFQFLFPFRYLLYPGELFWTEEGYRFSWRVMLMEKAGYAQFTVQDTTGRKIIVNNTLFLTPLQEKMMSTQPDMLLQYAHFLRDHFAGKGFRQPSVYVDSYVALNGRFGRPLVAPDTDLARERDTFLPKSWITPFDDTIYGF